MSIHYPFQSTPKNLQTFDSIDFPFISNRLDGFKMGDFVCWDNRLSSAEFPKHGYVNDTILERIWFDAVSYGLRHVIEPKLSIAPDFTVYTDSVAIHAVWQVFRSRAVAAFWQSHGVFVIPTIQWSRPAINALLFSGLSDCEVFAIRSPRKGSEALWVESCRQFQLLYKPKLILQFGTRRGIRVWDCDVANLNVGTKAKQLYLNVGTKA